MSLIPWNFDKFFGDGDDWLLPVFPRVELAKPAMDIKETDDSVVAEIEIPGFDPQKIDVTVEDGVLQVSGKMDETKEEKEKGYWRKEIRKGSFKRMVRLPVAVKENELEATYEKGVLKIVMPKAKVKSSKKVKIKVKGK